MRHQPRCPPTSGLQHLWYGVASARKGWLERKDVVNCLPLGKIEAVLQAKRRKRNSAAKLRIRFPNN